MKKQYTQCLECRKVKTPSKDWEFIEIDTVSSEISHTYCHDCVKNLKERLRILHEFAHWNKDQQLEFLKKDLNQSIQVFDKNKLAHYLREFFNLSSDSLPYFLENLKEYIQDNVCGYCGKPIMAKEDFFGEFPIHTNCKRLLDKKIQVLWDNQWAQSEKLCAYLDMLQIPKHFKDEVKKSLQETIH